MILNVHCSGIDGDYAVDENGNFWKIDETSVVMASSCLLGRGAAVQILIILPYLRCSFPIVHTKKNPSIVRAFAHAPDYVRTVLASVCTVPHLKCSCSFTVSLFCIFSHEL